MCLAVGHPVQRLIRVRIGTLQLGDLPPGAHRPLTQGELSRLLATVGMEPKTSAGASKASS
jgi:16S rRNA U516 pseudouridylate synthase RsuA-like enzyme